MSKNMFCFQCEQTAGCAGCTGKMGVCGKSADVAGIQDRLTGALIGLGHAAKGNEGKLTDETRYDTPLIALNASLLSEGIVLSSERGGAVTADEIRRESRSNAMWRQETPWGIFDYEDSF